MRKPGADAAQITPTPNGWRLHLGGEAARTAATLAELALQIPEGAQVGLALPCHAALIERLTLPATDREELAGMIELHLEKTLPYPVEEVTSGFQTIAQTESETTLSSVVVHAPVLNQLCRPLRDAGRLPSSLSLFALDLAPHLPAAPRVAAVWAEQDHLAIGIFEEGKLGWAYSLHGTDAVTVENDLPPALLTAVMEGVSANVETVALTADCADLRAVLGDIFGAPVEFFPVEQVLPRHELNLLPPEWAQAAETLARRERLQQRLLMGAVAYLLLVAFAFVYLAWTKRRLQVIEANLARTQPAVAATQQQQARLLALAPATERSHFAVEQLYLVNRNRPADVHITQFDSAPDQWVVKGEAPNAGLAVDFFKKLQAEKELSTYNVDSPPPKILPNNHAQFSIFGKLMSRVLTQREKVLSMIVGGAVLFIVNLFVLDYFFTNRTRLLGDIERKGAQLRAMQQLLAAAPHFAAADAQLRATQPRVADEVTAGVQLLNQVQEAARQEGVTVEQPAIGPVEPRPYATSVSITLDTKSTWKALIVFLSKLQSPQQFIVVESGELQVDGADPTQMRGKFKISKWYAPK